MLKKIVAISFIYLCTVSAWFVLGGNVERRTNTQDAKLRREVGGLWGTDQNQPAPDIYYLTTRESTVETKKDGETVREQKKEVSRHPVPLESSAIQADLSLNYRKKGLLWYSTYKVGFTAKYTIKNPLDHAEVLYLDFAFPNNASIYDDFRFIVNGVEERDMQISTGVVVRGIPLEPGKTAVIDIAYQSQGLDQWWYSFGENVTQVRDFSLSMTTDFDTINFPEGSISPTEKERLPSGWKLRWDYRNLLSGVRVGMVLPQKLNPGPWVSRVTFGAPISLFLFFFLLFLLTTLHEIKIHPMNYFFVGASFFSFHLLLAYLVDHISIHFAFALSSGVSLMLVVSYMRLILKARLAVLEVAIAQFVYLVLFSYTFFFEDFTGLAVTVLCVLTLFLVMQYTGKVDWEKLFRRHPAVSATTHGIACPYCRAALQEATVARCTQCGTLHHDVCWNQHGGCALFGCHPRT